MDCFCVFVFQDHILKPKGVAIAVLSQYGVMPLTAFCLAKVCSAAPVRKSDQKPLH